MFDNTHQVFVYTVETIAVSVGPLYNLLVHFCFEYRKIYPHYHPSNRNWTYGNSLCGITWMLNRKYIYKMLKEIMISKSPRHSCQYLRIASTKSCHTSKPIILCREQRRNIIFSIITTEYFEVLYQFIRAKIRSFYCTKICPKGLLLSFY